MIKVSDFIAKFLAEHGVKHVFMVPGGHAMHINESFYNEDRLTCVFNHHEQASAIAAEAYARITNTVGVVCVTAGPGGINALNGVFGAWTDSIPLLVISGQTRLSHCRYGMYQSGLRQLGDQENDIISMVKGITKAAEVVVSPHLIRWHLERMLHICTVGAPGPCWLDVPIDMQSAMVDECCLSGYYYDSSQYRRLYTTELYKTGDVLAKLKEAKRPVILAGTGVHLSNSLDLFHEVIHRLNIPVVTGQTHDIIITDDELFCGRQGTVGTYAGNFAVQNADLLLVLGCRLNVRQVGYVPGDFAKNAYKIQVDINRTELNKSIVKIDMPIACDLNAFLKELLSLMDSFDCDYSEWLETCRDTYNVYPVVQQKHRLSPQNSINPYHFFEVLFDRLDEGDIVVLANGAASVIGSQVAYIKKGQRVITNSGSASMGYDLPAAIGAAFASNRRIVCVAGDGSIQMNIQELQTISHYQLPIIIFVLSNGGYLSIKESRKNVFHETNDLDISFPNIVWVAGAYHIPAFSFRHIVNLATSIDDLLDMHGPVLCDIIIDREQGFEYCPRTKMLPNGQLVSSSLGDNPYTDGN